MQRQKLSFVSDEILYREVRKVLDIAQNAVDLADAKLYKNVVDPFSAVFDSMRQGVDMATWLEQERARQIQKTMQNAVGDFHQAILGNVAGWEDLRVGGVVDLKSDGRRIIAEVKNKHNTTKGNHKKVIYDDLKTLINGMYKGYTGYYVEIIPKTKRPYDKPFTPSDNDTNTRRPIDEHIRVIDGRSFYGLVTGGQDALAQLYLVLPDVIADVLHIDPELVTYSSTFRELFEKAYPVLK